MTFNPQPKRGMPEKQPKPLKRRSELRRTPAVEGGLSTLRQQAPAQRRRGRRAIEEKVRRIDEEMREQWKAQVCADAGGRCQVTGEPLTAGWEAHHVIPQSTIYATRHRIGVGDDPQRLAEILWDPRNGLALCKEKHDQHTARQLDREGNEAVTREHLRPWHWWFARDLDALLPGTQWASAYLERAYPGHHRPM